MTEIKYPKLYPFKTAEDFDWNEFMALDLQTFGTNRVRYGLENVHYAVITLDPDGKYIYGKPVHIPGAVSMEMSPTGDATNFYADNGVYFSINSNTGYDGTLSIATIPDQFKIDVLGETLINGGLLETGNAKTQAIALMYQVEGDVEASRFVFYDVTVARPTLKGQTTAESIEIAPDELTMKAKPRTSDKAVKWVTGEATPPEMYKDFFKAVVEPVAIIPPSGDGASLDKTE